MRKAVPRILITPGEPAGIGPDIVLKAADTWFPAELIVVASPDLLEERARRLGIPIQLVPFHAKEPAEVGKNRLKIIPVDLPSPSVPGRLNPDHAAYVIACLELAAEFCLEKKADALVTGPVQKAILNQVAFPFTGHTEFLAEFCGVKEVLMLFVVDDLRVALATTHLPLASVAGAITQQHLSKTIRLLHKEMQARFHVADPKIYVCGLNPHAGEGGLLGREEIEIIMPVLDRLRNENIHCVGPLPADTLFIKKHLSEADVILSMYHDQALPIVKYIGFDRAVNVTLGLPIVRTSVDHGTALDLAGTHQADPGSMLAAIKLAINLL